MSRIAKEVKTVKTYSEALSTISSWNNGVLRAIGKPIGEYLSAHYLQLQSDTSLLQLLSIGGSQFQNSFGDDVVNKIISDVLGKCEDSFKESLKREMQKRGLLTSNGKTEKKFPFAVVPAKK